MVDMRLDMLLSSDNGDWLDAAVTNVVNDSIVGDLSSDAMKDFLERRCLTKNRKIRAERKNRIVVMA